MSEVIAKVEGKKVIRGQVLSATCSILDKFKYEVVSKDIPGTRWPYTTNNMDGWLLGAFKTLSHVIWQPIVEGARGNKEYIINDGFGRKQGRGKEVDIHSNTFTYRFEHPVSHVVTGYIRVKIRTRAFSSLYVDKKKEAGTPYTSPWKREEIDLRDLRKSGKPFSLLGDGGEIVDMDIGIDIDKVEWGDKDA